MRPCWRRWFDGVVAKERSQSSEGENLETHCALSGLSQDSGRMTKSHGSHVSI
jgi:hypothetical protein